ALLAVAEHAGHVEGRFPGREVCGTRGRGRERHHRAAGRHWVELALEAEQPEAVAARRAAVLIAGREREHVPLAVILQYRRGRVHPRARLDLPELLAVARVERREPAVGAAHEHEPARGRDRPRVARLCPVLLPDELVRAHVERGEYAERVQMEAADAA